MRLHCYMYYVGDQLMMTSIMATSSSREKVSYYDAKECLDAFDADSTCSLTMTGKVR